MSLNRMIRGESKMPMSNTNGSADAPTDTRLVVLVVLAVWCVRKRPDGDLNSGPWLRKPRG